MGIIEVVKRGFAETSKLLTLVLIFFLFNLVIALISLPMANPAGANNPGVAAVSVIASILFFLVFVFLQGGALGTVKDLIKSGSASLAQFTSYGKKYYLRIIGLLLLYVLIAIAVILVLSLIAAGIVLLGDNVVTRSIVAAIVTVAVIAIITFLIYPVYTVVVDDIGPVAALKKGVVLAKENFVKTLGTFLLMLVIMFVISLIIGFLAGLVTIPLGDMGSKIVLAVVNAGVQSYIPVVMMVAFMTLYMSLAEGRR